MNGNPKDEENDTRQREAGNTQGEGLLTKYLMV
jgi:hypothetical protein